MTRSLIAVVGTTGTGKSALAVALARHLGRSEVLNADALQVYAGLDVMTNKVTEEEKQGVKHHLLGFKHPREDYVVGEFVKDASALIDQLHEESKTPIVVGGTAYYLQHLLFPGRLASSSAPEAKPGVVELPPVLQAKLSTLSQAHQDLFALLPSLPVVSSPDAYPPGFPLELLPPELRQRPEEFTLALYAILKHMDPDSASRWHWRDVRKVRRALEIVQEGRTWAQVVEQQRMEGEQAKQSKWRTLVFWVWADQEVLDARLDGRVGDMMDRGLLEETKELQALAREDGVEMLDTSKGIFQAIGYKSFLPHLLDPTPATYQAGIESTKLLTRQYARRQLAFLRGKLYPAIASRESPGVDLVLLDATTAPADILRSAYAATDAFLASQPLPAPMHGAKAAAFWQALEGKGAADEEGKVKVQCDVCTEDKDRPFMIEKRQLEMHLKSKTHRRRTREAAKANGEWVPRGR